MIKVRAHTCYLGHSGYSAHSRSFFRELSKHVDLRVRNYTWDSNPDYINETDLKIIDRITLRDSHGEEKDYPITNSFPNLNWKNVNTKFVPDVDIVLMDMDHFYFYDTYNSKIKIAYTVWESTLLPDNFFNQLLKFDYLWVVTEWHKEIAIKQGYPPHRIYVVNEGVSGDFFPSSEKLDKFTYMFFGRWDYRKCVPEIIQSFLEAFPEKEDVQLILSADNPYSVDGMSGTEERLNHYGFNDERIIVKNFLSREEYKDYLKKGQVLITCARSEGWNIPLIEAMACGTPTTYSKWGGQMEFTKGEGNPVNIIGEFPASIGSNLGFSKDTPGMYSEPDFKHLKKVLNDLYVNYSEKKQEALKISERIRRDYDWEKISIDSFQILNCLMGSEKVTNTKELVVIMSHSDSEEKISILKSNLLHLKNQGYPVLVSSHIELTPEIYEISDFVIIDKENPIIHYGDFNKYSKTIPIFYLNSPEYLLTYSFEFNHGLAAMRLCKNGLFFAYNNRYEITHFVNYDYILRDPQVLKDHVKSLGEGNDLVSYKWNNGDSSINTGIYSAKTESVIEAFKSVHTTEDYFRWEGAVIYEDVLSRMCQDFKIKVDLREISEIKQKNIINSVIIPTYPLIKSNSGERFHIFLGESGEENYICFIGGNSEPLEIHILYGETEKAYETNGEMKFLHVPKFLLSSGIKVSVPKYSVNYFYNTLSKKAKVEIRNKERIFKMEGKNIKKYINPEFSETLTFNFVNGPFVEIKGENDHRYFIEFIDRKTGEIPYSNTIGINCWARCSRYYYTDWKIRVKNLNTDKEYEHEFNLENKRVLIRIESKSLGDTLCWFPYAEEFRKKYNCQVIISTFKNFLFEKNYPDLIFIHPGEEPKDIYASFSLGWFFDGDNWNPQMHPFDFRKGPMQKTSTDILGLEYFPLRPKLNLKNSSSPIKTPYVCLGMHSTAQAKYWNNPSGWQEITDYFNKNGYSVVMLSIEEDGYMGNYYPRGVITPKGPRTLEEAMNYLYHCDMFIGIGSGLSWLSWSLNKPTVIISGWSLPYTEVSGDNVIRVFKGGICTGCFNRERLDPSDWNWCPDHKGTHRQFECSRSITGTEVIERIKDYLNKGHSEKSIEEIVQESYELGMIQNHKEIMESSKFFKTLGAKNFMEIGTDQGGTFAIWSKLSKDGKRISIDIPHGNYGVSSYDVNKRDEYLKSLGSNVTMIHGDSQSGEIKNRISSTLKEGELDFLFIDGDHTYEGVKKDYENYKKYVKPGGWIGFHDIKDTEFHRNANCRVDLLWDELEGEKIEFVDNRSSYGGIGFIRI